MESQNNSGLQQMADEIHQMFQRDQEMVVDPLLWNSDEGLEIKKKHAERLKEIIAGFGWPSISRLGVRPASEAWFLVQHADHDLDFQKQILDLLKGLPEGEVHRVNIAMLEDRVRKNQGLPQIYGTQWVVDEVTQEQVPYLTEDPEGVDERRKKMGLDSLEENRQRLKEWSEQITKLKEEKK